MALPAPVTREFTQRPAAADDSPPELRLVRTAPSPLATTVLCTADDEFVHALTQASGLLARVAVTEQELGHQLDGAPTQAVIVDGSSAHINPHRLARQARAHPASPAVWLMVTRRDAQSTLLARALGAELLTKRVRNILAAVDPSSARQAHIEALSSVMGAIDAAFLSQAGPLGQHSIQTVRDGVDEGHIPPTAEAYAQALVTRLHMPGPRATFVARARAALDAHRAARAQ